MSRDLSDNETRKKNSLLSQYYGTCEDNVENPLDLDGKHFQAEIFVDKLVKVQLYYSMNCIVINTISSAGVEFKTAN